MQLTQLNMNKLIIENNAKNKVSIPPQTHQDIGKQCKGCD